MNSFRSVPKYNGFSGIIFGRKNTVTIFSSSYLQVLQNTKATSFCGQPSREEKNLLAFLGSQVVFWGRDRLTNGRKPERSHINDECAAARQFGRDLLSRKLRLLFQVARPSWHIYVPACSLARCRHALLSHWCVASGFIDLLQMVPGGIGNDLSGWP